MEWVWIASAAVIAFYAGRHSISKRSGDVAEPIGLAMASDRDIMLTTFRRELSNYLVRREPDVFVRTYRKAMDAEAQIENAERKSQEAMRHLLTEQYKMYEDFDIVQTRPYVLYADALNMHGDEIVADHFITLVKFHALQRALDPDWRMRSRVTSEKEFDHLRLYVRRLVDTKFRQKLEAAVQDFFANRLNDAFSKPEAGPAYENSDVAVYYVPHIPENRYGFHFKQDGDYGLFTTFHSDEKTYEGYYRSDASFQKAEGLDVLRIDEKL